MDMNQWFRYLPWFFMLTGCGNSLNCAINGDNLKGRILYSSNVPIQTDSPVVVEWSKDSFSTVSGRFISDKNVQGLVTVPYSLCVDNDVDVQLRSYEDVNGDNQLTTGEYAGRYDKTDNGDGTYTNVNIPSSVSNSNWKVSDGIDITLDTP
jgi:hypothetical protein